MQSTTLSTVVNDGRCGREIMFFKIGVFLKGVFSSVFQTALQRFLVFSRGRGIISRCVERSGGDITSRTDRRIRFICSWVSLESRCTERYFCSPPQVQKSCSLGYMFEVSQMRSIRLKIRIKKYTRKKQPRSKDAFFSFTIGSTRRQFSQSRRIYSRSEFRSVKK